MKANGAWRLVPVTFAAFLFACVAATALGAAWPRSIILGTASPGGPYYVYGEGLARILTRALNIEVIAQVTQGPAQNIVLMEKKEAMLGFITMGAGLQAWKGTDWTKGIRYREMRVIFPMFDTAFQFAALKSVEIKSLDQLDGKRVGVGPRAGTGGTYLPPMFNALAISPIIRHGSWDGMKAQAIAGDLHAIAFVGGVPFPALAKLNAEQAIDFIEPSAEQVAVIRKKLPEFSSSLVRKGTYPSLEADYATIGLYNFAIAHKDLPEELVYRIVKAAFDNRDELVKAYSAAKETVPGNIGKNVLLPMHPGAVRYYREIGVSIPSTPLVSD